MYTAFSPETYSGVSSFSGVPEEAVIHFYFNIERGYFWATS